MDSAKIATAAVTGTSAMTLFSYIISENKNKQFREPEILAQLIQRLFPNHHKIITHAEGWFLHYAVGTMFCIAYDQLWKGKKPTLSSGVLLGALCGLVGITVWKATLTLHPNPPAIDFKKYASHLLVAHLIFGGVSALGYRLLDKKMKPPFKLKDIGILKD